MAASNKKQEETQAEETKAKGGNVYRKDYRQLLTAYQRPNGRKSLDNGDDLAVKLRGMKLDELFKLASKELGVTQKELHEKYDRLNPGMQRMNLGNRIRGAANRAARAKQA